MKIIKAQRNSSNFNVAYRGRYSIPDMYVSKSRFVRDVYEFLKAAAAEYDVKNITLSNAAIVEDETDFDISRGDFEDQDRLNISCEISANSQTIEVYFEYMYDEDENEFISLNLMYDREDEAYDIMSEFE